MRMISCYKISAGDQIIYLSEIIGQIKLIGFGKISGLDEKIS